MLTAGRRKSGRRYRARLWETSPVFLGQAEIKAVAAVQAMMGIVPLTPKASGKGKGPVIASVWSALHGATGGRANWDAGRVRVLRLYFPAAGGGDGSIWL